MECFEYVAGKGPASPYFFWLVTSIASSTQRTMSEVPADIEKLSALEIEYAKASQTSALKQRQQLL